MTFTDSPNGFIVQPDLKKLPSGFHGFHIHEDPSCGTAMKEGKAVAGLAAGGHLDPKKTNKHLGPNALGHTGDCLLYHVCLTSPFLQVGDVRLFAKQINEAFAVAQCIVGLR